MNSNAVGFFHRHAIFFAAPFLLLTAACVAEPYPEPLSPPIPDLAGTHWSVSRIDGRDTLRDSELTADFGVDGHVNGESGCNRFSGPFVQTGESVSFGELLSSRRACAEADRQRQEDRMLAIMRGATTVRMDRDELHLRGAAGTMTFVHAALADVSYPRRVDYDCQGVVLSVEYGEDTARLTWPDGSDVLERHASDDGVVRYESAHSELRFGQGLLWDRDGAPPRSCFERR